MKTCRTCGLTKPLTEFYERKDRPGFRRSECRACWAIKTAACVKRNRPRIARLHKLKNIRRKYGLSPEQYEAMLQQQGNRCRVCQTPFHGYVGPRSPCVDHCHTTNRVRGLLCRHCNFAIGLVEDNPEILKHMLAYLGAAA